MSLGLGEEKWEHCDEERPQKNPAEDGASAEAPIKRRRDSAGVRLCRARSRRRAGLALAACWSAGCCTPCLEKPVCTSNKTTQHLSPEGLRALLTAQIPESSGMKMRT